MGPPRMCTRDKAKTDRNVHSFHTHTGYLLCLTDSEGADNLFGVQLLFIREWLGLPMEFPFVHSLWSVRKVRGKRVDGCCSSGISE